MGKLYRPSLDRPSGKTDEFLMPPCTQVDPNVFIQRRTQKLAKRICLTCPVLTDCRTSIMHRPVDPGGVYGALTQDDRADMRRRIQCQP